MAVSQNKGFRVQGPRYRPHKYYNPYYGDPQKGTPNFGNPFQEAYPEASFEPIPPEPSLDGLLSKNLN